MGRSFEIVCVGGGVIGLMTALELARRGKRVAVLDRQQVGREASWAGAGILPPANLRLAQSGMEKLRAVSFDAYPRLAEQLRDETGSDVGLRNTGGIEIAFDSREAKDLADLEKVWLDLGIEAERLPVEGIAALEPSLQGKVALGYHFPKLRQIRNPWLLRALQAGCVRAGVEILPNSTVEGLEHSANQVQGVFTSSGRCIQCSAVIITAGAWSGELLKSASIHIPVRPVQGQMIAIQTDGSVVQHVVMVGKRYFVPRDDGLVLVGSTEDEVGFDKGVTKTGIDGLLMFAYELFPNLRGLQIVKTWAGLRPALMRGFPILGRAPGWENLWIATGHFRQGLQLAPGTAQLLADWMIEGHSFAEEEEFAVNSSSQPGQVAFRS